MFQKKKKRKKKEKCIENNLHVPLHDCMQKKKSVSFQEYIS